MPGLLRDLTDDDLPDVRLTRALVVHGEPFANAAAKFWTGLLDELAESFSDCSLIELSAAAPLRIDPDLLFPENALQRHIDDMAGKDAAGALEEALAEMAILGPPGPVQARLFSGPTEILQRILPLQSVDSETFSYLLVWLLHWARIPASRWNERFLCGRLNGHDPGRGFLYRMTFSLNRKPLAEGLCQLVMSIVPQRTMP